MEFIIVDQHPRMLEYVDYLQHKNAEALSFYPKSTLEREMLNGRILLSLLNDTPCGYAYIGATSLDMKIHQICIEYDARRRLYGANLATHIENIALKHFCRTLTLRCGFDLEANEFWKSLNYQCIAINEGGIRRRRKINVWCKFFSAPLFVTSVNPAKGVTDASLWRKNKNNITGISQFSRGKKLNDYRASFEILSNKP